MSNVSRRTIAKGAAWAVPAIVVASPAPALAASGPPATRQFSVLSGCKLPGNSNATFKGYAFAMTASNTTSGTVVITINSITLNGTDLGNALVVDLDTCTTLGGVNTVTLPANTTYTNLALVVSNSANSASGTVAVDYTTFASGTTTTDTLYTSVDASPTINGATCSTFTSAEKACLSTIVA